MMSEHSQIKKEHFGHIAFLDESFATYLFLTVYCSFWHILQGKSKLSHIITSCQVCQRKVLQKQCILNTVINELLLLSQKSQVHTSVNLVQSGQPACLYSVRWIPVVF